MEPCPPPISEPPCRTAREPRVRRDPSLTVLHRVLQAHLETFLARFRDQHGGLALPLYVQRELRAFLSCGDLAQGFVRIRCPACMGDLLVAFS